MPGKFLLDTNVVVALLAGEPGIEARLGVDLPLFLSPIVVGELLYGAAASGRPESNTARIDALAAGVTVLRIDEGTARCYGGIKADLKRRGRPIPENDVWIAASALQHDLVLVSRDRHFDEVAGLEVQIW